MTHRYICTLHGAYFLTNAEPDRPCDFTVFSACPECEATAVEQNRLATHGDAGPAFMTPLNPCVCPRASDVSAPS